MIRQMSSKRIIVPVIRGTDHEIETRHPVGSRLHVEIPTQTGRPSFGGHEKIRRPGRFDAAEETIVVSSQDGARGMRKSQLRFRLSM